MVRFNFTLILLLLKTVCLSQNVCDKNYISKIETDSCLKVEMSLERFTYFYKADMNMKKISKEIPELKNKLDSISKLSLAIDSSFNTEIDTLRNQKISLIQDMDECVNLSVDLEIENIKLIDLNQKLKIQRNKLAASTSGSVILLIIGIIIVL